MRLLSASMEATTRPSASYSVRRMAPEASLLETSRPSSSYVLNEVRLSASFVDSVFPAASRSKVVTAAGDHFDLRLTFAKWSSG